MKPKRPIGFLNIDLEIESPSSLNALIKELGKAVTVLYSGPGKGKRHLLFLETSKAPKTPDAAVLSLCLALDRLSAPCRRLWDRAIRKEFDVGYELPGGLRAIRVSLQSETLKRVTALGATVAFTCYNNSEPCASPNGGPATPLGNSGVTKGPPLVR